MVLGFSRGSRFGDKEITDHATFYVSGATAAFLDYRAAEQPGRPQILLILETPEGSVAGAGPDDLGCDGSGHHSNDQRDRVPTERALCAHADVWCHSSSSPNGTLWPNRGASVVSRFGFHAGRLRGYSAPGSASFQSHPSKTIGSFRGVEFSGAKAPFDLISDHLKVQ